MYGVLLVSADMCCLMINCNVYCYIIGECVLVCNGVCCLFMINGDR